MHLRDTDFNFIGLPVRRRLLLSVPFLSTGGALAVFILTGISLRTCPRCRDGQMRIVDHLARACCGSAIPDTS